MIEATVYVLNVSGIDHRTTMFDCTSSNFEDLFIRIRNTMTKRSGDDTLQDSDLDACHQIARNLSQHYKKI